MLLLRFFFLLRSGEYAHTSNPDATPFRLQDTHILINDRRLNYLICAKIELQAINYIGLEFTMQKNGERGELVGLRHFGHPTWCPIEALINRVKHLHSNNAMTTTLLYTYYDTTWKTIDTTHLTMHLRNTVTVLGPTYGIQPTDISIHSLRSSGAMALLCTKVDTDMIRLLGHWRSNEMLHYLHVQSFPLLAPLAHQMLHHGHYTLMPNLPMG